MYDSIMLPTDGSEAAEIAANQAFKQAELNDATLHVVYVLEVDATGPMQINVDDITDRLKERGEQVTKRVEELAESADIDVVTSVLRGNADEEIVDYVSEHGIDLIVMGTHGRRGIRRHLLGSVTERVIRQSPVPVMAVRDEQAESA